MTRLTLTSAVLGLLVVAPASQATIILAPGSTWEHTFTDPTGDADWNTTTAVGGIWSLAPAPFGNTTSGDFAFATYWGADGADGDDLWVRVAVDLTGFALNTIEWDMGTDNGHTLYANGNLIHQHNAEGFTFRWEYTGNFGNSLVPGVNVIAVALEDHGGATAFDMQIRGAPIPAPSTLAIWSMFGGSVAAGLWRRRKPEQIA